MSNETLEHDLNQLVDEPITILVPWCNNASFAFFGHLESFIDDTRVRFHFVGESMAFIFGAEDVVRVDPPSEDVVSHIIVIKKLIDS